MIPPLRELVKNESGRIGLSQGLMENFKLFVKMFFWYHERRDFVFNHHHEQIIEKLMAVVNGSTKNLIINMPPRYSKTELVIKLFSAWCYARNQRSKFMHLSYSDGLVLDNSSKIKEIIKLPEYQFLFPQVRFKAGSDSKGSWELANGGSFYATSSGGSVTGFGAGAMEEVVTDEDDELLGNIGDYLFHGAILIDDPLKPDDAYSEKIREFINNRWHNTIKSRKNNPLTTPVIVVQQRLHEHDFTAMLQEEGGWEVLSLEALITHPDGKKTALWPAMHTVEALETMQATDIYTFASQYQQKPTPLGGGIIKADWITYYTLLPNKWDRIIVTADTAAKAKTHNDWSVIQLWGRAGGYIYLLDQVRGKMETPELIVRVKSAVELWRQSYKIDRMLIEDASSGTGLIQTLKREMSIPIIAVQRGTDKVSRMMVGAPYFQSGMVLLPAGRPWVKDYVNEVLAFSPTMAHAHDDQVDPTLDAIDELLIHTKAVTQTQTRGMY